MRQLSFRQVGSLSHLVCGMKITELVVGRTQIDLMTKSTFLPTTLYCFVYQYIHEQITNVI